ncbi:MAG: ABC transporter ATP-binding protein [Chloroflexota bacterium]|nr:ABC transporter ATP-binding protein [Chloroflexota bacterium]
MMPPKEPVVRVVGLTRVYQADGREVEALRGVDLTVPAGHFVAVRGRSGSGKTTLLNCIGGLDRPTSGKVYLRGQPLASLSEAELTFLRRERLGFVFQSFALLPTFSAYENVELPLRIQGLGRAERRERTLRGLTVVGLRRWANHRPYEMSGGQQQRVVIARALVTRPDLILADEPTGELDSETGRRIMALLQRIVERERITLVMATHDPLVLEYASLLYELRDGQIERVVDRKV